MTSLQEGGRKALLELRKLCGDERRKPHASVREIGRKWSVLVSSTERMHFFLVFETPKDPDLGGAGFGDGCFVLALGSCFCMFM